MNAEQTLIDLIECPKTVACLDCCGYKSLRDFINFNEESINRVELAVSAFTRGIPFEKREIYLYPEYIEYPELFKIKPHIRSKILSLANQISKMCNPPNIAIVEPVANVNGHITHTNNENETQVKKKPRTRTAKPRKSKSETTKVKITEDKKIYDVSQMSLESDSMHRVVMRHAQAKFFNCDLTMERDFHIYRDPNDPKLGYFECLICKNCGTSELGNKTVIKYRYAQYGSLIFINIQVHLEKHFSRVQPNKRRRLTKKQRDPNTSQQHPLRRSRSESDISTNSEVVELVPKLAPKRPKVDVIPTSTVDITN